MVIEHHLRPDPDSSLRVWKRILFQCILDEREGLSMKIEIQADKLTSSVDKPVKNINKAKEEAEITASVAFLTADEIYAIDKITEVDLPDFLLSLAPEKRELASHIFSKNRSVKAWKVIADEQKEGVRRLTEKLKANGVAVL